MTEDTSFSPATYSIVHDEAGLRLDHFLTGKLSGQSRSAIGKLINGAHVLVDGFQAKPGRRLREGEVVAVTLPPTPLSELVPEPVDFSVLYEDSHLLVINKPPGLVVHPGSGHCHSTLVHGLLYRCRDLPAVETHRPGIVHRLDKDTSGALLVAKTEHTLRVLMADFKQRRIRKTYHALLLRCPRESSGRVVAPVGRHPVDRKKMAIRPEQGRYAATTWQVLERFTNGWCWAEIDIETGRTHQIRVHMASLKAPVLGDALYGGSISRHDPLRPDRQMLHASTLCFRHPLTGEEMSCTAPLAEDMCRILEVLRG